MVKITAEDIDRWANRIDAFAQLPRLISRLIWASCHDLSRLDMPGGEQVYLSGFDGVVQCVVGTDIVPPSISVWELSARSDVATKAREDYEKRTAGPDGIATNEITFVFATPRLWNHGEAWAVERKAEGRWKEVRVLQSRHLEMWLDRVPWIAAEFGAVLGISCNGMCSIRQVWDECSGLPGSVGEAEPNDMVLAGRGEVQQKLLEWLGGTFVPDAQANLRIAGPSIKEVLHFLAASVRSLDDRDRQILEARLVVVTTGEAASILRGIGPQTVLIAASSSAVPRLVHLARNHKCRLVILHAAGEGGVEPLPQIPAISLGPTNRDAMIRALVRRGYREDQAIQLCENAGFDYGRVRQQAFLC